MTKQKNNFIPINDEQIAMIEKTEERKNRFSGESYMLNQKESIIHDRIFLNELAATLEDKAAGVDGTSKLWDKVRKDINYFRQHNAEAYMVLLD